MNTPVPLPAVMPVDRAEWAQQIGLCNFVNSYYQYRDLQLCAPVRKVLIVGTGNGLDAQILQWRGYHVRTFDIDSTFNPDEVGSVHDLSRFADGSFDVIIASHVLEHLAVPYLNRCLEELARVARFSIVYLPVAGRHFQWRLKWDLKGLDLSFVFDLFNYFHRPDGVTARYCQGQHFWEQGMRGFTAGALRARFRQQFDIVSAYRNRDWLPSYNWILRSKQHDG
jgi:Methyltransferase domain